MLQEDNLIAKIGGDLSPHYEPFGWHHWPEHPWFAYQFRRGLGETQEGGGTVSNPTIGQELMADWLADTFGIDQRRLPALAPLV